METFTYWGKALAYYDHPYNQTAQNERAVELAIAKAWREDVTGWGLEVGNVTSHYWPPDHEIVDLYEEAPGVRNVDVLSPAVGGPYPWVLSISTLEHVGWDYPAKRRPRTALAALERLRDVVRCPGAPMLLTVPLGHHRPLDRALLNGMDEADRACTLIRDGAGWRQTDELTWRPYGASTPWAEAVWIGEWT